MQHDNEREVVSEINDGIFENVDTDGVVRQPADKSEKIGRKSSMADDIRQISQSNSLSDATVIANTNWANLKESAMRDDYKQKTWFVSKVVFCQISHF